MLLHAQGILDRGGRDEAADQARPLVHRLLQQLRAVVFEVPVEILEVEHRLR